MEDEAAYLRERVRAGELSQERLQVAAYCGHKGATRAAGGLQDSAEPGTDPHSLAWWRRLSRWPSCVAEVALQAARELTQESSDLDLAERWLRSRDQNEGQLIWERVRSLEVQQAESGQVLDPSDWVGLEVLWCVAWEEVGAGFYAGADHLCELISALGERGFDLGLFAGKVAERCLSQ